MSFAPEPRRYTWRDGRAIIGQTGTVGELWLSVDRVYAGHYLWGGWGGEKPGADFREWLLDAAKTDPWYIVDKLCYGHPDLYDADRTDRAVREWIISRRRSYEIDQLQARQAWDEWVNAGPPSSLDEFNTWHDDCSRGRRVDYIVPGIEIYRSTRWGYDNFLAHMPQLAAALQADLATSHSGKVAV